MDGLQELPALIQSFEISEKGSQKRVSKRGLKKGSQKGVSKGVFLVIAFYTGVH